MAASVATSEVDVGLEAFAPLFPGLPTCAVEVGVACAVDWAVGVRPGGVALAVPVGVEGAAVGDAVNVGVGVGAGAEFGAQETVPVGLTTMDCGEKMPGAGSLSLLRPSAQK
jgi:hypothetical protein